MKKILLILLVLGTVVVAKAQDQVQFSHYIANQGMLNPAYNGTRDVISGILMHRSQWVGFKGAPMSQGLNVHGPIEDTDLGAGLVIINDHTGFHNRTELFGAASYKLQLDRNTFVSLGLQLGANSLSWNGTQAVTDEYGDPIFMGKKSQFAFNFGFGSYLYASNYFAGFSIPRFFSNNYDIDKTDVKNTLNFKNMHMYLYGGYVFEVEDILIKPTLLMKEVYGAPMEFDISCSAFFMEQLWVGLSYRTISEAVLFAEYAINRQWAVRYSFDYTFSKLNTVSKAGSHEIGIQFDFSLNKRPGMRSIRYF